MARNATSRFGRTFRWKEHKKVYTTLVAQLLGSRAPLTPVSSASADSATADGKGVRRNSSIEDRPMPK